MPGQERTLIILEESQSTNLYALENIDDLPHLSAIFADKQSSGRGRLGRKWHSPVGNIYASFVIKENKMPPPCYAFAVGLAGLHTLEQLAPQCEFRIKLPNDIICENRKIGGVLCENRISRISPALIAGIGLNINSSYEELKDANPDATSLLELTGKLFDLNEIRMALWKNVCEFCNSDENKIIQDFVSKCVMIGKTIAKNDAEGKITGCLKNILADGAAVIELPDGSTRKLYSGDFVTQEIKFS